MIRPLFCFIGLGAGLGRDLPPLIPQFLMLDLVLSLEIEFPIPLLEESSMTIRLLVADDHEAIRIGLAGLLAGTDIEIVAEAATGRETVEKAQKCKPDVVLLDVRMPGSDVLSTLEQLRVVVPFSCVLMLSTDENPACMAQAVGLGISDCVLKSSSRDDLISAITTAAEGEPLDPFAERPVEAKPAPKPSGPQSKIRMAVLLSVLGVALVGLLYDYCIARPSHRRADQLLGSLLAGEQDPNGDGIITDSEVHSLLGREPSDTQQLANGKIETYRWVSGMPTRKYQLWVAYSGKQLPLLHSASTSRNQLLVPR